MRLIDQILDIFQHQTKALHVDEIAKLIIQKYPNTGLAADVLSRKVSAILAADVKKRRSDSLFGKIKNKTGGFQRGIYKLKIPSNPISRTIKVPEQPKVSPQFTGKAGEYAVMSELLFYGFNVSAMTVDDGIDVIASKGDSYFHIQVKTSNVTVASTNKYQFRVTKRAFGAKDAAATFYVLVMRVNEPNRNTCEYIVLPSSELRRLVDKAVVRDGDSLSIAIERERGNIFRLNGSEDVSWALNRFDNIK